MEDGTAMTLEPSELVEIIVKHGADASLASMVEEIQARYLPRAAPVLFSQFFGMPLSQALSAASCCSAFGPPCCGKLTASALASVRCLPREGRPPATSPCREHLLEIAIVKRSSTTGSSDQSNGGEW